MKYIELKEYMEFLRINTDDSFNRITTVPKDLLMSNMEYARSYAAAISNTTLLSYRDVWKFDEIREIAKQYAYVTCNNDMTTLTAYLYNAIMVAGLNKVNSQEEIEEKLQNKGLRDSLKSISERSKNFVIRKDFDRCIKLLKTSIGTKNYERLENSYINYIDYDLIIDVFELMNEIKPNESVFDTILCLRDRYNIALCKNMLILIRELHLSEMDVKKIYKLIYDNQFLELEKMYYGFMRYIPMFVNFENQLDELSIKKDLFSEHLSGTLRIYDSVVSNSYGDEYIWINELEVLYPYKGKYINFELEKDLDKDILVSQKRTLRDEQREQISELLHIGVPVMLVGPYGCGKEELFHSAALEYANKNDKEFIYRSGDKYRSIDEFNKAYSFLFKNGGVFYLRGYDSSLQEIVDEINCSKRYQIMTSTTCGDELVGESPDFRLGVGVDTYNFASRQVNCGDTILRVTDIDKYVKVDVDYDHDYEEKLLESDKQLYNYIKEARDIFAQKEMKYFITTRDLITAKKLIDSGRYTKEDIIKMVLFKHLNRESLELIEKEMSTIFKGTNPYCDALSLILQKKRTTE